MPAVYFTWRWSVLRKCVIEYNLNHGFTAIAIDAFTAAWKLHLLSTSPVLAFASRVLTARQVVILDADTCPHSNWCCVDTCLFVSTVESNAACESCMNLLLTSCKQHTDSMMQLTCNRSWYSYHIIFSYMPYGMAYLCNWSVMTVCIVHMYHSHPLLVQLQFLMSGPGWEVTVSLECICSCRQMQSTSK